MCWLAPIDPPGRGPWRHVCQSGTHKRTFNIPILGKFGPIAKLAPVSSESSANQVDRAMCAKVSVHINLAQHAVSARGNVGRSLRRDAAARAWADQAFEFGEPGWRMGSPPLDSPQTATPRLIQPTRAALGVSRANIQAIVYPGWWKHRLSWGGAIGAWTAQWRTGTIRASESDPPSRIGTDGRVRGRSIGWTSRG
jgi:hypothetical protein